MIMEVGDALNEEATQLILWIASIWKLLASSGGPLEE
jgi:hypothetical protein